MAKNPLKWARSALGVIALGGALALMNASTLHAQIIERAIPGGPVAIDSGRIAGKVLPSGVQAWFGIPYVAAPLRELRWRAPQPVAPWTGVYNADRMAPECLQTLRGHRINHYFGDEPTSEDCLYLNVWAPSDAAAGDKRPVIVWIYGGALTVGSAGMANYGGEPLAQRGVVYVNFNYRVGALGFIAHPELTAESPHGASGNYGFMDQIAALQWIRRNIAQFGGDPDNVTVVGQSGGSRSVTMLTASPLARGLFHRALGMSGTIAPTFGQGILPDRAAMEAEGVRLQQLLGADSIEAMRRLPGDRIVAVQPQVRFGAAIDGYVLPEPVSATYARGAQNDVPMIMGFTRDESNNALSRVQTLADYRAVAHEALGADADEFLRLYPARTDAEARAMGAAAAREGVMGAGMRAWALAQAETGRSPSYLYMFSRVQPYTPGIVFDDHNPATAGAYHTGDVPYWLGTIDALNLFRETRTWTSLDRNLTAAMQDSLIAFARTGNPSTPAMRWPAMNKNSQRLLEIGDTIQQRPINARRFDFMAGRQIASGPRRAARD
ncbi:MAG TPA: carboxylesterase family protein [Terricaulis sp.]|nr:carboxylesterase family protein [Terricaulis sp.]